MAAAGGADDDYPCVRRLRHRRLLAYLHNKGYEAAFHSMIQELGQRQHTIFSAAHLRKLLAGGRWGEAVSYVRRFLPLIPEDAEARALILFLTALRSLANTAATGSSTVEDVSAAQHRRDVAILASVCHRAKPSSHVTTVTILNSPLYRASLDWEVVKREASSITHDLALESPELSRREVLRLPAPGGPYDVLLPIFRQRRRHLGKKASRPTASAIAKLCLALNNKSKKKMSQPSSSGPLPGSDTEVALDWATDLIEKCLKAGNRPELHQGYPLESTRVQGLNKEESTCVLYVENHCQLNPNTVLVEIGGYRLQDLYMKCLTIDKTHDGREKFIPTNVMNLYIKLISHRRASCVSSKRFLVYDSDWAEDIPSIVGDVSSMKSVDLVNHAKSLIQSELVFLPMVAEEHIIVLVVNNKSKQFQVLDSARTYSQYQSHINDRVRWIKNLLEVARKHGLHDVPDATNWPINQIYHIPPQEDGCSCSLFALKYIELWDGERLSTSFNQSDIHSFRVQVLVELLLSELNAMNDIKSELRRLCDEAK